MKIDIICNEKDLAIMKKLKVGDSISVTIDFDPDGTNFKRSSIDVPENDLIGGRPDDRHPPKP